MLCLLTARPFHIAEDVAIRAGALGSAVQGRATDMTLLFVQLRTEEGTVLLPNSAALSAALARIDSSSAAHPLASPSVPAQALPPAGSDR